MNKPKGFDEAQEYGEFKKLPPGGYICRIMKLEEAKNKSGGDMIIAYLDIADGEYKGYFSDNYKARALKAPGNAVWGCRLWQNVLDSTTGLTSKGFKSFITSVEKSNPGFVSGNIWGEKFITFFKDKTIGCLFNNHHYISAASGKEATVARAARVCSVDTIKKGDFKIPEDTYDDSMDKINTAPAAVPGTAVPTAPGTSTGDDFLSMGFAPLELSGDDLPF